MDTQIETDQGAQIISSEIKRKKTIKKSKRIKKQKEKGTGRLEHAMQ